MSDPTRTRYVLLLADSLAFHGPRQPELLTEPRIYPRVLEAELARLTGGPVRVDVVARLGWTARDGWWAFTKDPTVYSELLPRADAVVIGLGGMDSLPAAVPTYLRLGLGYLRPARVRRPVRLAYHRAHPYLVRAWRGRLWTLPPAATEHYLGRLVQAVRHFHPGTPVVAIAPPDHDSAYHGRVRTEQSDLVARYLAWGEREQVPVVETEPLVGPERRAGGGNSDGMHWGWDGHRGVGVALAEQVAAAWAGGGPGHRA